MVLHSTGTTQPTHAIRPENMKCSVYFPPHLVAEQRVSEADLAHIVQFFAQHIAVPMTLRSVNALRASGMIVHLILNIY